MLTVTLTAVLLLGVAALVVLLLALMSFIAALSLRICRVDMPSSFARSSSDSTSRKGPSTPFFCTQRHRTALHGS